MDSAPCAISSTGGLLTPLARAVSALRASTVRLERVIKAVEKRAGVCCAFCGLPVANPLRKLGRLKRYCDAECRNGALYVRRRAKGLARNVKQA